MNTKKYGYLRAIAIEESLVIARNFKHVSFVLYRKNLSILSIGTNCKKTHPLIFRLNPRTNKSGYIPEFVHSELDAYSKIRNLGYNQKDLILVNFRIVRNGEDFGCSLSKPCLNCQQWTPLLFSEIYYSIDNETFGEFATII